MRSEASSDSATSSNTAAAVEIFRRMIFFNAVVFWDASPAGHGLVQADAAFAATPLP
jgi:hypothetical protein